jgi:hypothetical protein
MPNDAFLIVVDVGDEDSESFTMANDITGVVDGNWGNAAITEKNLFDGARKVFVLNEENILAIKKALPDLWISAAKFQINVREATV